MDETVIFEGRMSWRSFHHLFIALAFSLFTGLFAYYPIVNMFRVWNRAGENLLELVQKGYLSDSFDHELYHGDEDQSDTAWTSSLKVFGEASGTIEPGKGPFDDPAFGLDFELVRRVFYQLHIPCPANPSPLGRGMIGSVSP